MSHRIVTWHGTFGTLTRLDARAVSTRCQPGRLIVAGSAEAQMTQASG